MQNRIWEIDFLRGIAIVLMGIFHLVVDLRDFYGFPFDYFNGFWYFEGKLSAVLFMLLAGISTMFGGNVLRHGMNILGWGMVLTVVTYFYNPGTYIRFGILHLLGVSLMFSYVSRKLHAGILGMLAIGILVTGNILIYRHVDVSYFLPLGLTTSDFVSMDYYPLLPWHGVFLCGMVLGRFLYSGRQSLFTKPWNFAGIEVMGRHSLVIYLVHQPIFLAVLYLLHQLVTF